MPATPRAPLGLVALLSIALGYVENAVATEITGFAVELIGERRPAVRSNEALFDPKGLRMRA